MVADHRAREPADPCAATLVVADCGDEEEVHERVYNVSDGRARLRPGLRDRALAGDARDRQRVRGADYGGTSWTTRSQAERVVSRLELSPGLRLLQVGGGAGWPGLFLATRSGCEVLISDLPLEGLRMAREGG